MYSDMYLKAHNRIYYWDVLYNQKYYDVYSTENPDDYNVISVKKK